MCTGGPVGWQLRLAIVAASSVPSVRIAWARELDENKQPALKDSLHVPVGPITRARAKMIKEALSG